jgi:DNA-directed RNA polymerase subunit RPC12/RpoP
MQMEKSKKACTSCETKYTIIWNINEQDLEPLTCPFCGHEVSDEEEIKERHEDDLEDEDWN